MKNQEKRLFDLKTNEIIRIDESRVYYAQITSITEGRFDKKEIKSSQYDQNDLSKIDKYLIFKLLTYVTSFQDVRNLTNIKLLMDFKDGKNIALYDFGYVKFDDLYVRLIHPRAYLELYLLFENRKVNNNGVNK